MNLVVPDSSVIVKWLSKDKEENLDQASRLLDEILSGKVESIVPELIKYEIGNVLLKSKKLTPEEANFSLETLFNLPITFVTQTPDLSKQTFELAYENGTTYYDASFLSLAKQYQATLVTADVKDQGKPSGIKVVLLKDY